jgi:predicted membrane protein
MERTQIINPDWDFSKMGIGGLDTEFNAIFRWGLQLFICLILTVFSHQSLPTLVIFVVVCQLFLNRILSIFFYQLSFSLIIFIFLYHLFILLILAFFSSENRIFLPPDPLHLFY